MWSPGPSHDRSLWFQSFYFHLNLQISLFRSMDITRRMAIANGTFVSFCNQPKAHFGLPWVRPWGNRGKCYMDGKRIQFWAKVLQHVPIYLQLFTSYSEILVGNCNFFLPPCF